MENSCVNSIIASIVITSRNRRDDVLRAVESCFSQDFEGIEVLVFDDASEDGTVDALKEQWPELRVFNDGVRVGYIVNRNRGFVESRGEIVFSIDDDAYFSDPNIVADTVRLFESDPSVGAVAIPYIEPLNRRSLSSLRTPFVAKRGETVRNYIGCAHAVRRDLALELNGYRAFFVHQGEERDFCIRLLEAGRRIVYGDSGYIVHMVSPKRDAERIGFFGARNQLLFNWLNLPTPEMLFRAVWDPLAIIRYRFTWRTLPVKLCGIWAGYTESLRRLKERRPVARQTYQQYKRLPSHGPEEWHGAISPPCCASRTKKRPMVEPQSVHVTTRV